MAIVASVRSLVCGLVAGISLAILPTAGEARKPQWQFDQQVTGETVQLSQLPAEGRQTYRAIFEGGPFPFGKDGSVFGNRERLLPPKPRGHYREYTVRSPGSRDRGAKRIVCGGALRVPDFCWYTADHYSSFRRIEP